MLSFVIIFPICFWADDIRFTQILHPRLSGVELMPIASLQQQLEVTPTIEPELCALDLALKSTTD